MGQKYFRPYFFAPIFLPALLFVFAIFASFAVTHSFS
jgi:hypothetical protein